MHYTQPHLTHSVVMVQPFDFGFNEETGLDNEFQHRPANNQVDKIKFLAKKEFESMVERLEQNNLEVLVLGKSHTKQKLPDAIFPNNWFSTRANGEVFIYPMKTNNRRAEVQVDQLVQSFWQKNYQVSSVLDIRDSATNLALEGTGSLIFQHQQGKVYASISERCDKTLLIQFCQQYHYQPQIIYTKSSKGLPIYHTNVLLSCGENFAVICDQVITEDPESQQSLNSLAENCDDLIKISESQMTQSFCGNILQLKSQKGEPCIVMSNSALKGFTAAQIRILEKHGSLIAVNIPTIENIGGGSARCMLAENFLSQC